MSDETKPHHHDPDAPCPDGDACPDARRYGAVHPAPTSTADERDEKAGAAMTACAVAMRTARDRIIEVIHAHQRLADDDGGNPEKWVDTFLSVMTIEEIGETLHYADVVRNLATLVWKTSIATATANEATRFAVTALGEALATGIAKGAITCSCGDCESCKLRDARGVEIAYPEIVSRMKARIVLPGREEKTGGGGPRIIRPGRG
jgi:hypothetical protein